MTQTDTAQSSAIVLPAMLDLGAAEGLLATLRAGLTDGAPVAIDASGVEQLTFPCAQIILSTARSAPSARFVNPSPTFMTALSDLGLTCDVSFEDLAAAPSLGAVAEAATAVPDCEIASEPETMPAPVAVTSGGTDQPPSLEEAPAEAAPAAAKRVLTIDDSKTMRDMLMLTLSSSGYDVLQAVDGRDGLDVLEKEQVDVVITDINMPKMDGYGVIEHLRGNPSFDATPILVLTTESDREKKDRARKLGATGFIVKPFNPTSLVDVIRKVSP